MPSKIRSLIAAVLACTIVTACVAWQKAAKPVKRVPPLRREAPRYWKGNLHTHSLWSDGDDFPEMIADWYKRHNYHFLALTDHNVLSEGQRWIKADSRQVALKKYQARFGNQWVEQRKEEEQPEVRLKPLEEFRSMLEVPGRFLLIPGEEITHRYGSYPVHINAINLRNVIQPVDGDSVTETIQVNHRAVMDQKKRLGRSMLAFLNHPNFGWGATAEEMAQAEELRYFEVYNGHPGVRNYGDENHPSTERIWDIVLALRLGKYRLPVVYGLATDDAHRYHKWGVGQVNPGRGWVMVQAPYLTSEAIVKGIESGKFYSSTGVTLRSIRQKGDQLIIRIRPSKGITCKTQFIATMKDAPLDAKPRSDEKGKELNSTQIYSKEVGKVVSEVEGATARYRLTGNELYVRAKIISSRLHPNPYQKGDVEVAWTQPVQPAPTKK